MHLEKLHFQEAATAGPEVGERPLHQIMRLLPFHEVMRLPASLHAPVLAHQRLCIEGGGLRV